MKRILSGLGVMSLCALCCGLPSMWIGMTGVILGFWKWGMISIALLLIALLFIRKNKKSCVKNNECDCSSSCNTQRKDISWKNTSWRSRKL